LTARTLTRRGLLAASAAAAATAILAGLRSWPALFDRAAPSTEGARLVGLLADRESARAVGLEYLHAVPEEASARVLVASIRARLPGGSRAPLPAGDDALRALVGAATCADFAEERLVEIRGWVLASTEARLCGLAALAAS